MKRLIRNRIQCTHCDDIIESLHRRDFKYCKCETCYVDGGIECQRIGFNVFADFKDLSEWEGEDDPEPIGVIKEVGDEWVLVRESKPQDGQMVLWLVPDHPSKPMFVAQYKSKESVWKCAHCESVVEEPDFWKKANVEDF